MGIVKREGFALSGTFDFSDEGFYFFTAFFAGRGFDAAGDVDPVWRGDADGFGDVLGIETAAEDQGGAARPFFEDVPIKGLACAAERAGHFRVDDDAIACVIGDGGEVGEGFDSEGFPDLRMGDTGFDFADEIRGFVAVQLNDLQIERGEEDFEFVEIGVDEDAGPLDVGDAGGFHQVLSLPNAADETRTGWNEIQADRGGASLYGDLHVLGLFEAADFDAWDHLRRFKVQGSKFKVPWLGLGA